MKKLRIEDLSVDSFEVTAEAGEQGTVRGFDGSDPYHCASGEPSCLGTCEDTCGLTCWDTCWPDLTCTCA
jgi:hypothetical protein